MSTTLTRETTPPTFQSATSQRPHPQPTFRAATATSGRRQADQDVEVSPLEDVICTGMRSCRNSWNTTRARSRRGRSGGRSATRVARDREHASEPLRVLASGSGLTADEQAQREHPGMRGAHRTERLQDARVCEHTSRMRATRPWRVEGRPRVREGLHLKGRRVALQSPARRPPAAGPVAATTATSSQAAESEYQ